jgi:3-phosphoglycerate kinase
MGGLSNTALRLHNFGVAKGYKTNKEIKQEKAAKQQKKLDKVYSDVSLPDDELIQRNARRKAAKRQGSRANTVLTDRQTLG